MSNRSWIMTCIVSVLILVMLNFIVVIAIDPYGLFRNPADRKLPLYNSDRMGKYLLNTRYVPTNFNALLIGPSSSVNWDPIVIARGTDLRFYNESLEGGNATEERLLADRALARGHYKVALLIIYPSMTSNHKLEEGLDRARWTQALGSLDQYIQIFLSAVATLHIHGYDHGDQFNGSHSLRYPPRAIDAKVKIDFHQDPTGLRNLETLNSELQSHGIRVVCIVPPVFQSVLAWNSADFAIYKSQMMSDLPGTTWIDLDAPDYVALRSDPANYIDEFHASPQGSVQISELLNRQLLSILDMQLPSHPE